MAVGDISIDSFTVGSLDLTDPSQVSMVGFNIYEDILNFLGPVGEVHIGDFQDMLGKYNITGSASQDVSLTFSVPQTSGTASFKFKLLKNKNLTDRSTESQGSMHSKFYTFRFVSPEALSAQRSVKEESFNKPTAEITKSILQNNFKTTKDVQIDSPTNGNKRMHFSGNVHPIDRIKKVNTQHVSTKNKSSCYVTFQTRDGANQLYKVTEFEELFKQSPVVKLKQNATLGTSGTSETDKQNSITWINISDSFEAMPRNLNNVVKKGYDATSGENQSKEMSSPKFNLLGKPLYDTTTGDKIPATIMNDAANNKTPTGLGDAKANRLQFLSHLSQNSADLEVIGNPAITLGSVIELDIPKKSNTDNESGESQFNGKALVVAIRHKVKPLGQSPRYTMILKVIKAAVENGGGGNG